MPDASGQYKGITVPAEAWERIFNNQADAALTDLLNEDAATLADLDDPWERERADNA